jgi:hypothetical protein
MMTRTTRKTRKKSKADLRAWGEYGEACASVPGVLMASAVGELRSVGALAPKSGRSCSKGGRRRGLASGWALAVG